MLVTDGFIAEEAWQYTGVREEMHICSNLAGGHMTIVTA